jgi:hypothetical protein
MVEFPGRAWLNPLPAASADGIAGLHDLRPALPELLVVVSVAPKASPVLIGHLDAADSRPDDGTDLDPMLKLLLGPVLPDDVQFFPMTLGRWAGMASDDRRTENEDLRTDHPAGGCCPRRARRARRAPRGPQKACAGRTARRRQGRQAHPTEQVQPDVGPRRPWSRPATRHPVPRPTTHLRQRPDRLRLLGQGGPGAPRAQERCDDAPHLQPPMAAGR